MTKKIVVKNVKHQVLLVVCGILAICTIVLTVNTATSGVEMSKLETKEQSLMDQRRALQENLVKSISSRELEEKSTSLGFVKPSNVFYISDLLPVASLTQ